LDTKNPERMGICRRLWSTARTTGLLAGAIFAAVMMVDLPNGSFPQASQARAAKTTDSVSEAKRMRAGRSPNGIQLASLGRDAVPTDLDFRLSGGHVRWNASSACLNSTLRRVVGEVAAHFGAVTVNSTCRSHHHNARVGGAKRSRHLSGDAADFRISGNTRAALAFLGAHRSVGGLKHYGGGVFHIDTGPRRTW
jgi:uncharacterized protein YcbK (DUF882 family)